MSRPLGPYQAAPPLALEHSDDLRSRPRRREFAWMAIAFALGCVASVGSLDLEAAKVTQSIVEEEGARVAGLVGEVIAARHAGDPRDLPQHKLSMPLRCLEPYEQWIIQWGDGRLPRERQADGRPGTRCTSADLRRRSAR